MKFQLIVTFCLILSGYTYGQTNMSSIDFSNAGQNNPKSKEDNIISLDSREPDYSLIDSAEFVKLAPQDVNVTYKSNRIGVITASSGSKVSSSNETSTSEMTNNIATQNQPYYVVVGSTTSQSYANDLAVKAREKGFDAEAIYFNENGRYRVCIPTDSKSSSSGSLLSKVRNNLVHDAWILDQNF